MGHNELRIGNETKQGKVICFYEQGIHVGFGKCFNFSQLEPITITNEWLLRFGFNKSDEGFVKIKLKKRGSWLELNLKTKRTLIINNDNFNDFKNVKYIHQLQNLYFALTNEELKLQIL